jgi:hypothetical protein
MAETWLIPSGAGDVVVRASQPGNEQFAPAPNVDRTISIARAPQTVRFDDLSAVRFGDGPLKLTATSSAGLYVSFELVSGPNGA